MGRAGTPPASIVGVRRSLCRVAALALLSIGLDSPAGAAANPSFELFEKSLQAATEAVRVYGSWDEPVELRRVAEIGYRVAREAGYTDYPISFYLIDLAEPNAFALPGGQVFVTRGLIAIGLGDDELSALLGHEIAHVVGAHGTRMERRATLLNILSQAALLGVLISAEQSEPRRTDLPYPIGLDTRDQSAGDVITGTYAAGMILSELLLRSYSRSFEDEADENGQRWAAAAGFAANGTERLMAVLGSRIPDSKEYGYWRTHPFFEQRVAAARIRARSLATGEEHDSSEFRGWTQKRLLELGADLKSERQREPTPPVARGAPERPTAPPVAAGQLVEAAALTAWPRGTEAERLRLERLHRRRDETLLRVPLGRDYGKLLREYDREIAEVEALDAASVLIPSLRTEREALTLSSAALLGEARQIWTGNVFETGFLETFLSNWPAATEADAVTLALAEAYSRTDRQADAVTTFLRAAASTDATIAESAQGALRTLAPTLDQLSALAELSAQERDLDLALAADERLRSVVATFSDLTAGAAYLSRFPNGVHAATVSARMNVLAENLYGEFLLYQSLGDHLKAIDRIERILTHAPTSPAAQKLLEKVVLPGATTSTPS